MRVAGRWANTCAMPSEDSLNANENPIDAGRSPLCDQLGSLEPGLAHAECRGGLGVAGDGFGE